MNPSQLQQNNQNTMMNEWEKGELTIVEHHELPS